MYILFLQCNNCHQYFDEIVSLKQQIQLLKKENTEKETALKEFLTEQQLKMLTKKTQIQHWDNETIMKSLKIRFAVGVHGFQFLREMKFPLPCYSTITRRLQGLTLEFGIFKEMLEPLSFKVQQLEREDRFCVISFDEMEISNEESFDKNRGQRYGNITIGKVNKLGNKLLLVLLRSVKNNWKQVIGAHITDGTLDPELFKQFIYNCIEFSKQVGLKVVSLSSDMGNENRSLWKVLGIQIKKTGLRQNYFTYNGDNIFIMPDVCHLIKNLKNLALNSSIKLPNEYCEEKCLPTEYVCGKYVIDLWNIEQQKDSKRDEELRLLYHLKREIIYPNNFQKMNVGAAVRFFSLKTAAALETAVNCEMLPKDALTTAHFIRLIDEWFSLTSSKLRKTSITNRNKEKKYDFLQKLIGLVEQTEFGLCGWKPLNVGIIMSSISIIEISELLFSNNFDFILCHRFTQDAVENIFSQIRRKAGQTPNAIQSLRALKMILMSQYISDVKRSNYFNDTDTFLLNYFKEVPENYYTTRSSSINVLQPSNNVKTVELDYVENISEVLQLFPKYDINIIFYLAGSATNSILKLSCKECCDYMCKNTENEENLPERYKFYSKSLNKGGLKEPCVNTILLIFNCELVYRKYKSHFLHNSSQDIVNEISNNIKINYPPCEKNCDVKQKLIKHFFTVRSYATCNLSVCRKRKRNMYGTASNKKNK